MFEAGVESIFFEFSEGCPRLMSLLADRVMLAAFGKQLRPVPTVLVERKAKEMTAARLPSPPTAEVPKLG